MTTATWITALYAELRAAVRRRHAWSMNEMKNELLTGDCISIMPACRTRVSTSSHGPSVPNHARLFQGSISDGYAGLVPGHEEGQKARRLLLEPRFPCRSRAGDGFKWHAHLGQARMPSKPTRPTKRSWYGAGITSGSAAKSGMCPSSTIGRCRTCRITRRKNRYVCCGTWWTCTRAKARQCSTHLPAQERPRLRARNSKRNYIASRTGPQVRPDGKETRSTSEHCVTTTRLRRQSMILTLRKHRCDEATGGGKKWTKAPRRDRVFAWSIALRISRAAAAHHQPTKNHKVHFFFISFLSNVIPYNTLVHVIPV